MDLVKTVVVCVGLGCLGGCDNVTGNYSGSSTLTATYPAEEAPYTVSRGSAVRLAETDDDFVEVTLSQFNCRIVGRRQSNAMISLDALQGQTNTCNFTGPTALQNGAHRFVVETGTINRAGAEMVMSFDGKVFPESDPNTSIGTFNYQFSGVER